MWEVEKAQSLYTALPAWDLESERGKMGIFSRLNRVIKSNLNALIDQAEDPVPVLGVRHEARSQSLEAEFQIGPDDPAIGKLSV